MVMSHGTGAAIYARVSTLAGGAEPEERNRVRGLPAHAGGAARIMARVSEREIVAGVRWLNDADLRR